MYLSHNRYPISKNTQYVDNTSIFQASASDLTLHRSLFDGEFAAGSFPTPDFGAHEGLQSRVKIKYSVLLAFSVFVLFTCLIKYGHCSKKTRDAFSYRNSIFKQIE